MTKKDKTTLILGGAGKTGRRVADRLVARGRSVRMASRSTEVPFDWNDGDTWRPALADVDSMYVTYYPDLAVPGAAEHVRSLTQCAVDSGVARIVLLAGRGEPQVAPAEQAIRESGVEFTILECAFFCQNFDEGWVQPVDGEIAFPAGAVAEPFIDCEDIAAVAAAALTEDGHVGQTYELTGPRLLTFEQAAEELSEAWGESLRYVPVSGEQYAEMLAPHLAPAEVRFFVDLFGWLLDGHNAHITDGVERALGRKPRDFREYARDSAWGVSR